MLVNDILETAGFVENETYRETRFATRPQSTYVIYHCDIERTGSDFDAHFTRYSVALDLYEKKPDSNKRESLRDALDEYYEYTVNGWNQSARQWYEDEQLYYTQYTFELLVKE